ncbi:MAG: serine/threonine-protein kinase [Eubacteriales bacterium]|nr:serine/threonine-protein kinase [Eubacteriales bacterium]
MTLEEQYRLSCYQDLTELGGHHNVHLIKHNLTDEIYTKKILRRFSFDVYLQLQTAQIPGIPQIHEMIPDGDSLILIEDYIHGQTLDQLLKQKGTLSEEEVFAILLPLCDTLGKLHRLNPPVVHRDLKLSNIIRTDSGAIYIVDFDTARNYEPGLEQDTELLGTKEYASPEQYGFGQSDARSDIYALGVIINRLLTGEYPKHQLCEGPLQPIVTRCTRMDPEARFNTVEELIGELEAIINRKEIFSKTWFLEKKRIALEKLKPYTLPGFRTGVRWKKVLAILGYAYCILVSITLDMDDTYTHAPLHGFRLWMDRIIFFGICLFLIFYNTDYRNMQIRSIFGKPLPLIFRIFTQVVISLLAFFFGVLPMYLLDLYFSG